MKFPVKLCLLLASFSMIGINNAQASGCYMVDASGRKIEMDFCGVSSDRPAAPAPASQQIEQPAPQEQIEEARSNQIGGSVTSSKWEKVKALVAQAKDKTPITYEQIKEVMMFDGDLIASDASGNQVYEWRDAENPNKKIVAGFTRGNLASLKGTVY
ncbi:hypothetical protein NIES593_22780 [Hydrococcus rivularis NIES-593]|uniref:Uncharacterized protein n=1 Tax=Hydrococcus rivularis NIES-593 TaxID=1921803 RepID=A0A1U7H709_9CYAN|nr:hypothetical protein [Hydrococcus rivularis]OKH17816.1 hypothetical protein NIES593_22780 [Hydrococcus rivularis NIES-593]